MYAKHMYTIYKQFEPSIAVIEDDSRSWCMDCLDCAVVACQTYRVFFWVYAPSKSTTAINVQVCLYVWLYVGYKEENQMRTNTIRVTFKKEQLTLKILTTVEHALAVTWIRWWPSHCSQLGTRESPKMLPIPMLDLPVYCGHQSN